MSQCVIESLDPMSSLTRNAVEPGMDPYWLYLSFVNILSSLASSCKCLFCVLSTAAKLALEVPISILLVALLISLGKGVISSSSMGCVSSCSWSSLSSSSWDSSSNLSSVLKSRSFRSLLNE